MPTAWQALHEWVRGYAGLDMHWDLRLVLRAQDVPEPRLGCRIGLGDRAQGRRLISSALDAMVAMGISPDAPGLVRARGYMETP